MTKDFKIQILKMKLMKVISDIFDRFGISDIYESDSLLIGPCPVHDGDNHSAFNINIDETQSDHYGKWFCNTKLCHQNKPGGDIISLVWSLLEKQKGVEVSFPFVLDFCEKICSGVKTDDISISSKSDSLDFLLNMNCSVVVRMG